MSLKPHPWLENVVCGVECPEEWEPFVDELIGSIDRVFEYSKASKGGFRIDQIKEKFGGLRFYYSYSDDIVESDEEYDNICQRVASCVSYAEGQVDGWERHGKAVKGEIKRLEDEIDAAIHFNRQTGEAVSRFSKQACRDIREARNVAEAWEQFARCNVSDVPSRHWPEPLPWKEGK